MDGLTADLDLAAPRRRAGGRARLALGPALVAPAFALMVLLVLVPMLGALVGTFFPDAKSGPSLANYTAFFANGRSVDNLVFTVQTTVTTLAILLVLGLVLSLYLRFSGSRLVGPIQVIALFPLFVPGIIVSFALIRFLGPTGNVATLLHLVGIRNYETPYLHPSGAIIGMVWENIPLTVMLLTAGLGQISDSAIEAARDVGAGWTRILLFIILPQLVRSLVVVLSLDFLGIFGSFTVPYILGPAAPQMMSVFMQNTFSELHLGSVAQTQAGITFLVCLVAGAIYTIVVFRDAEHSGAAK